MPVNIINKQAQDKDDKNQNPIGAPAPQVGQGPSKPIVSNATGSAPPTITPSQMPDRKQGSGFTNINKYQQANDPKRVAQATSGAFQQRALQQIGQNLQTSQRNFGQNAQQEEQRIGADTDFAQQALQTATGMGSQAERRDQLAQQQLGSRYSELQAEKDRAAKQFNLDREALTKQGNSQGAIDSLNANEKANLDMLYQQYGVQDTQGFSDQDLTRIDAIRNQQGAYQNLGQLQDFSNTQQALSGARTEAQDFLTDTGRLQQLRKASTGTGQYTAGQQSLDRYLLGSSRPAAKEMGIQAAQAVAQQQGTVEQARQDALNRYSGLQTQAKGLGDMLTQGATTGMENLKSNINQSIQQRGSQLQAAQDSVQNKIRSGQALTDADLSGVGFTDSAQRENYLNAANLMQDQSVQQYRQLSERGNNWEGYQPGQTTLGELGKIDTANWTPEMVASQQQMAQSQALERLLGKSPSYLTNLNPVQAKIDPALQDYLNQLTYGREKLLNNIQSNPGDVSGVTGFGSGQFRFNQDLGNSASDILNRYGKYSKQVLGDKYREGMD